MSQISVNLALPAAGADPAPAAGAVPSDPADTPYVGDLAVALFADVMRAVANLLPASGEPVSVTVDPAGEHAATTEPAPGEAASALAMPAGLAVPAMALDAAASAARLQTARVAGDTTAAHALTAPVPTAPGMPQSLATLQAASAAQAAVAPALADRQPPADDRAAAVATPAHGALPASGLVAAPDRGGDALHLSAKAPAQWRQPLQEALGDRLQLQLKRGSEQAVIRLDPPSLGTIEIVVRQEAGGLQVHLRATHGEVLRQLQHVGDSLRHDLAQRQQGDVTVTVSDGAARDAHAGGRQRSRDGEAPHEQAPGQALHEADDERPARRFALDAQGEHA